MDYGNQRVVQGAGIYHNPKVKYSPETRLFLKELMDESKLTMLQREKVNYSLRTGDPLPSLNPKSTQKSKKMDVLVRPGSSKRRSYATIKDSGVYEREKFVPSHSRINRDFAKKHLQDLMEYGKDIKDTEPKPKNKVPEEKFESRFEELKNEIQERVDWLADMEKLGEGYKHRQVIEQQIAVRINEMEKLKLTDKEGKKK